jgi:predicted nuclease of predicted toxin-antitoxin system
VSVKLLCDENISPWVSQVLRRDDGIDACGVRDRGLLEASDAAVLARAFSEDRILVTKNVKDFDKLARASELHAGIVFIEAGGLRREEQLKVIREALAAIERHGDMANAVLRIAPNGTMTFEEMPWVKR